MGSQTGCTKVSWKLIGQSVPDSFPKSSLSSSSRGDVLIRSGFLVVAQGQVPRLHWVQWHWSAPHRVHLVWRRPVPKHRFHSLPKGASPTCSHTSADVTEACSLSSSPSLLSLSASSQELPTPWSKCLSWMLKTPLLLHRLTCQPLFRTCKSIFLVPPMLDPHKK